MVLVLEVARTACGDGDHLRSAPHGDLLGDPQDGLGDSAPLRALVVERVEREHRPAEAQQSREGQQKARADRVDVQQVVLATARVPHGAGRVRDGLGVAAREASEADDADAAATLCPWHVGAARVDGHAHAALDQSRVELLDVALDAAVDARHPPRADDRYAHRHPPSACRPER